MRDGRNPFAAVAPIIGQIDALIIAGDLANNPLYQWLRALVRIGQLIGRALVGSSPATMIIGTRTWATMPVWLRSQRKQE